MNSHQVQLQIQFSCAHFYSRPEWSEEQNLKKFGKCFTAYGHGHDYVLQVLYDVTKDSMEDSMENSMENNRENDLFVAARLRALTQITEELDHQHLNFVIEKFKSEVPTTENLALYCLQRIEQMDPEARISLLRLYEQPDLWVELRPHSLAPEHSP